MAAAGKNRNGHRDHTMILVAYRHGLRAAELVSGMSVVVDIKRANCEWNYRLLRHEGASNAQSTRVTGGSTDCRLREWADFL